MVGASIAFLSRARKQAVSALFLAMLIQAALAAGTGADIARQIRESSFDPQECYRVRDLTLTKEDIRLYFTEGHLIFSKPVAGHRIAALFVADVEGGDGEVILLPPDRAERRSLAGYIDSPNLDEHFHTALLVFTGDEYEKLVAQFPNSPANQKSPEAGPAFDEQWTPVLRNLATSYLPRLTMDLLGGPSNRPGLLAALISGAKLGNFDITYDPLGTEQIVAGEVASRNDRLYFDVWTSFTARSFRASPSRPKMFTLRDYRIQATVNPDLSMDVVTRVKVKPGVDGLTSAGFDVSPQMEVTDAKIDGAPVEVLQRESLRLTLSRGGNNFFLVIPAEPLRAGREYEFEFHHSGRVIFDAGDRVFYVAARANWYPMHGTQFATYDLQFRYPKELELVSAGDVVEDRTDDTWRITRRRTPVPIRTAAFNLGNYKHARLERNGYVIDVCANRALERSLQPRPTPLPPVTPPGVRPPHVVDPLAGIRTPAPDPLDPVARLERLASDVDSALEFMASRFGPPALNHITVSPIPGTFGQGFPGLIYLSTLSYLKNVPGPAFAGGESQEVFFQELLQAHETAHQWWGNRVSATSYRDYWLMEALANYSALLYLEKSNGAKDAERTLDSYRTQLLAPSENGPTVDSTGPIVLGTRLETSQEPRAWRAITYGKGTWIMQMLRQRMGDERFFAMLAELLKQYDGKEISTDGFRELAARFLPPKSEDPKLEAFFDAWVYGTGIPNLKLEYTVRGKAPNLRLMGTLTQSDVDEYFTALTPIEIQVARGKTITRWVASASSPVTFSVPLQQAPLKVTLDPHRAVLRR